MWGTEKNERLFNWNHQAGQLSSLIAVDFSPDGKWALTAEVHTLVLWNREDGSAPRYWTAPGEVLDVALSANGNFALLGMSDHTAVIFDIRRGGILQKFQHNGRVRSVDLSSDNQIAITGSEDGSAVLWDMSTGKRLFELSHDEEVTQVLISADGKRALSAAKYDKTIVWDTTNGQVLGEIPIPKERLKRGVKFSAAQFNPDGSLLLTGLPDREVQLWNLTTFQEIDRWLVPKRDPWKPTSAAIIAVSFTTDPKRFKAMASNGFIHQLDRSE
ncbi:WD40 repeat domain-containing protein [Aurantivibrio infirmus]